jgi:hypothetical protein
MGELNRSATLDGWLMARDELSNALERATSVLGRWGIAGLTGDALRDQNQQISWLQLEAVQAGISTIWMVGGEPRHPSRWHQFISDKYSRTTGGSFAERLDQVLESVPISTLRTNGGHRLPVMDDVRETHDWTSGAPRSTSRPFGVLVNNACNIEQRVRSVDTGSSAVGYLRDRRPFHSG